jgi:hypothetical protein
MITDKTQANAIDPMIQPRDRKLLLMKVAMNMDYGCIIITSLVENNLLRTRLISTKHYSMFLTG